MESLLNTIRNYKSRYAIIVFLFAFAFRTVIVLNFGQNYTQNTDIYHDVAVNICLGNGYSKDQAFPYKPFFFREPMYPLFLASVFYCYQQLGGELEYLNGVNLYRPTAYEEIKWARLAQAIIGAVTCLIFFLTLKLILNSRLSFLIALLFSAYLPLVIHSSFLIRETFQTFVIVCVNFTFAKFLLTKKAKWIIIFSFALAISNLTLQVTILVPLLAGLYSWVHFNNLREAVKWISFSVFVATTLVLPWVLRTYTFYPDVRVFKTFGCSLTYEYVNYVQAYDDLALIGKISADSVANVRLKWYALPEKLKFERSFSGYIKAETELIKQPVGWRTRIRQLIERFRISWIESLWFIEKDDGHIILRPHSFYLKNKNYIGFFLSLSGFLFGYIALFSLFLFYRKLNVILLMFSYFLALFPFIGNEPRRLLTVHAFIFMFSCLSFFYLYNRLIRKKAHKEICNNIFN